MKKLFKFIKSLLLFIIIIILITSAIIVMDGYNMYSTAISSKSLENKISEVTSDKNYVSLDDLPTIYKDAVVSVEDHRFYSHSGIDIIGTIRAIFTNVKNRSIEQGGSSITQQLARNLYFSQEQKLTRKIAELFVAYDLEKNNSKDKILELYINTIYFGKGYYGIREASEGFFQKNPIDLSDYEATLLAGVPNAPSAYNPITSPELANQRQKQVLKAMVKHENLTQDEADKIMSNNKS